MPIEPPLVLDTDFLSSFAWVNRLEIIEQLYFGEMIILEEVMIELGRVTHLEAGVKQCVMNASICRVSMLAGSYEALELARLLDTGKYGRGECACMAYLKYNPGTLGSNNLRDIKEFCMCNNKQILCTGDCLCEALQRNIITLSEGNDIWRKMIEKRRKLPTASFSEYISGFS